MGYCMSMREQDFFVPVENLPAMVEAIHALSGKETIGDSSGRHFSWVDQNFHTITDPKRLLDAWRWDAVFNDNGDIDTIYFGGEKLGDDEVLFTAIGHLVKAGSYIEMQGEDGCLWRWVFDGKSMTEQSATITWE